MADKATSGAPAPLDQRGLVRALLTVTGVVTGVLLLWQVMRSVTAPLLLVLLALVLTMALNPLVARLKAHLRVPRTIGAVLVVSILGISIIGFSLLVGPKLISEGATFGANLPTMLGGMQKNALEIAAKYPALAPMLEGPAVSDLGKWLSTNASSVMGNVAVAASGLVNLLVSLLLLTVMVLFMLINPEPLVRSLMEGVPPRSRPVVERVLVRIGAQLGRWMVGMLIVSSIVGILIGVGLAILGFRDAFLFGAISAVANVVPIVGPFSALIPPVLFAASEGNWGMAALAVVVNLSVQQIDAYVISPFVLRRTVAIHPVSGIVGLLVFGALLGAPGVLLAMPLVIIVKALYEEVYLTGLKRPEADEDSVTQVVSAGLSRSEDELAKPLVEPVMTRSS
jgi:putative permease